MTFWRSCSARLVFVGPLAGALMPIGPLALAVALALLLALAPLAAQSVPADGVDQSTLSRITSLNQCFDTLPSSLPLSVHAEVQTTDMHGGRLEAILQFNPDLVLANPYNSPLLIARLRERGFEVLMLPEPESLAEVAEFYALIDAGLTVAGGLASGALGSGALNSQGPAGDEVWSQAWPQVWRGQRVLMLQANHYSFGQKTLWDDVVTALGGENIAPGYGLVSVLPEQVLALDPDVIVSVQGDEFALAARNSLHRALAPLLESRGIVVAPQWMGCMAQQLDALVDELVGESGGGGF